MTLRSGWRNITAVTESSARAERLEEERKRNARSGGEEQPDSDKTIENSERDLSRAAEDELDRVKTLVVMFGRMRFKDFTDDSKKLLTDVTSRLMEEFADSDEMRLFFWHEILACANGYHRVIPFLISKEFRRAINIPEDAPTGFPEPEIQE